MIQGKKAAEMTIGTIIVIILALLVLVLLVLGFSTGWSNLWDKITNLGPGGQSNVDTIVQSCNIAKTTDSSYEYCRMRDVKFGKDGIESAKSIFGDKVDAKGVAKLNCKNLEGKGYELDVAPEMVCEKSCKMIDGADCKLNAAKDNCAGSKADIVAASDTIVDKVCVFNPNKSATTRSCDIIPNGCSSLNETECKDALISTVCVWA